MNPREYEIMSAVEADHWWYRSLRDLMLRTLIRFGRELPGRPNILDAGCGTGENLRFLQRHFQPSYLGGFDCSEQATRHAKSKCSDADIYLSDIRSPELHCDDLDVVISCDVIYIPGLDATQEGLKKIVRSMRSGGLLIINLPAYNWLRSDHDLAIRTSERFVASELRKLLNELGLQEKLITYRLCGLLPLLVASRLPSMLRPSPDASAAASALKPAGWLANAFFGGTMQVENGLINLGLAMPFGSSLFAVGQKS